MHLKISSAKNGHFVQGEMSFQEARFIITLSTGWQNDPSQTLLQGDRLPQNEEGLPLS